MIISKDNMGALADAIGATQTVYVPGTERAATRFVAHEKGEPVVLDGANVRMPPKDLLFPATEKMYRWKKHEGQLSLETEAAAHEPFTVLGVRPCDMASVAKLDLVFLTKGFVDEFYQARRDAATFVAVTCVDPDDDCFCEVMGVRLDAASAADVLLVDRGGAYEAKPQTEKGEAAVAAWAEALGAGADAAAGDAVEAHCTLNPAAAKAEERLRAEDFDDVWHSVADYCLTCGTCTFECPTCYCFDISQDVRADEGARFRCWDSCMFTQYTLMAGNHNPRADRASRVRQRFMHKLRYFADRYGEGLCVGCGRCIRDCPAGVDIAAIIDAVATAPEHELTEAARTAQADEAKKEAAHV